MTFSSRSRILVFIVYAWAILDHADRPHLPNYLRDYVNEYDHFEKLKTK